MASRFVVRTLRDGKIEGHSALFGYCVGFETRSRFIAQSGAIQASRTVAIVYGDGRTLAFSENLSFAQKQKLPTIDLGKETLESRLNEEITLARRDGALNFALDVSSMNRAVMATAMISILDAMKEGETLNLLYAPSRFKEPKLELLPIEREGAPHARISGEVANPGKGRALLLGIGFEYGVSLNILDKHEPDISFIFRPNGYDPRFSECVKQANFGFDFGEREYEIIDYHIADASPVYDRISSLVLAMKHSTSILAVPLGPKLISAIMILVGYVHQPSVSVVRYSLASWNFHHDIEPAGMVVGFSVTKVSSPLRSE